MYSSAGILPVFNLKDLLEYPKYECDFRLFFQVAFTFYNIFYIFSYFYSLLAYS